MKLVKRIESVPIRDISEMSTKTRLIAAGEKLLGERGIDTMPLHEIALEAGQANKYAVQYHFRDREGLIQAIFSLRLLHIENRQKQFIELGEEKEILNDLGALLELLYLPIAEQVDDRGRHSYARFLLQYVTRPDFDHTLLHPLGKRDDPVGFVYARLMKIIREPGHVVMRRLYLQTLVFLGALIERDNALQFGRQVQPLENTLSETLSMMVPAMKSSSMRTIAKLPVEL